MFIDRAAAQKNPLSVVALNVETGKVDGVMVRRFAGRRAERGREQGLGRRRISGLGPQVNEDWKLIQPSDYRRLPSDWRPVRAVFNELHTRFKATVGKTVEPGEMLHCLYFTCVRPEARQQGVMRALWGETLQVAEDNNFEGVVAEASSKDVRDVLDGQLGFDEVASVEYEKFMFEGTPIFKELVEKDPAQLTKLSIHLRKINSNLY